MEDFKRIQIKRTTHRELEYLKAPGQSFDGLLQQLMKREREWRRHELTIERLLQQLYDKEC
jgi:hypothetical protein